MSSSSVPFLVTQVKALASKSSVQSSSVSKGKTTNETGGFKTHLSNQSQASKEQKGNALKDPNQPVQSQNTQQAQQTQGDPLKETLHNLKQLVKVLSNSTTLTANQKILMNQLETQLNGANPSQVLHFLTSTQGQSLLSSIKTDLQKSSDDGCQDPNSSLVSELFASIGQFMTVSHNIQDGKMMPSTEGARPSLKLDSSQKAGETVPNPLKGAPNQATSSIISPKSTIQVDQKAVSSQTVHVSSSANAKSLLIQQNSGRLAKDDTKLSSTDQSQSLNLLIGGSRQMGKVQQLIFYAQNNAHTPSSSPADQILNKIQQIMNQGLVKKVDGGLTVQLQLNPNNLGPVQLTISQTDAGLSAAITAHSSLTKDLIEGQLSHLEQALSASGIPVHKLDVSMAPSLGSQQPSQDAPFQQPKDQQNGNRDPQSTYQEQYNEKDSDEFESFENWLNEVTIR